MREDDARGAPQCRQTARFRASRGRLAGSIACDLHEVRFVVVEDAQRRDPASESLGIGGMSVKPDALLFELMTALRTRTSEGHIIEGERERHGALSPFVPV